MGIGVMSSSLPEGFLLDEQEDTIEEGFSELPEGFVLDEPKEMPGDKPSLIKSWIRSLPKGALKQLSEDLRNLPGLSKEQRASLQDKNLLASTDKMENILNDLLPTKTDIVSRGLEKGGRNVPYLALGGKVPQAIAGGAIGGVGSEMVKDLGGGELSQLLTQVVGEGIPGIEKSLIAAGKHAETINWGRKMGMTDEAITRVMQPEWKQRLLSKLSPKRGRTQRALKQTQEELGTIYKNLSGSKAAQGKLNPEQANQFAREISEITKEWPAELRDIIRRDALDLANTGFSGAGMINFWQDLGHYIPRGSPRLGELKGPLEKGMRDINPQLAKDFKKTNELYSQYVTLRKSLKPSKVQDFLSGTRGLRIAYGAATFNIPVLAEAIGESAAKRLSREFLINPRFQQLGRKFINAINQNKYGIAKQAAEAMGQSLEKEDPKAAKALKEIKLSDIPRANNNRDNK